MALIVDYGDVEDISSRLLYPSLVFSIVTPFFIIARFISRRTYIKSIGPDDWVILGSLVFAETVSIQMIIISQWAFGKHKDDVPPSVLAKSLKLYFYAQILYKINIGLTKISILLLYIKLFVRPPWFTKTCWACIGVVIAFTAGTVFSSIFQCIPVQFAFNKTIPGGGTCINLTAFWFANAAFNISSDFVIMALPVPVISSLKLPLKTKIALCGVFAVGTVVCVTSVLRITTLDIATAGRDISWTNIGSSMWTIIESNLGIICACLPPLWRPISIIFPTIFGHLSRSFPPKQISSNTASKTVTGSRRSKKRTSSSVPSTGTNIRLQSMDHGRRQDDPWAHVRQSTHGIEFPGGGVDTISECRGSQDPIVEAARDEEEAGVDRIRKTTQVVVEYDNRSEDEEEEEDDDDDDDDANMDIEHSQIRIKR